MELSLRRMILAVLCFFVTISVSIPESMAEIVVCDSNGTTKETFYVNETIYMIGNVSRYSANLEAYLVADKNDWVNGTSFEGLSLNYWIVTTTPTGDVPLQEVSVPGPGSYDVAIDVDENNIFNTSIDVVDSLSTVGFQVIETPKPVLTVSHSTQHPSDHSVDLTNMSEHNLMMQMNLSASVDDVAIDTFSLLASGSGNDKDDIKVVYLILDSDSDGIYDVGIDGYLAYSYYMKDDGIILLDPEPDIVVPLEHDITLMVSYTMGNTGQVDEEYLFNLISADAYPKHVDETVQYSGFPLKSATKKISVAAIEDMINDEETEDNATTITDTTTTTALGKEDECDTDEDCVGQMCQAKSMTTLSCEYDETKGIKVCKSVASEVDCCEDEDCSEDELCINQECSKKKGLFGDLFKTSEDAQQGEGGINVIYIIAILVVIVLVIAVLLYVKNRSGRASYSSPSPTQKPPNSEGGGEWGELKGRA